MHVNGHQLHIETHGPEGGLPVVLLHHGLGSARAWKEQTPVLAAAGYRVIVYDRWGYGQSDGRAALGMPTFDDDVADLLAILDAFHVEQAALVGHSDGGTIALYFASRYPERVCALVCVAAHIYVEAKMGPGIDAVSRQFASDSRFRGGLQRIHGDRYQTVFDNWYTGWKNCACSAWDMRPLLKQIICPALVVQGENDEHATPQHAQHLAAALPRAELWLPGAGHMLPQDQPQHFNARLLAFLPRSVVAHAIRNT